MVFDVIVEVIHYHACPIFIIMTLVSGTAGKEDRRSSLGWLR